MRFSFLTGDVDFATYGGKWISTRQSNGEFDYYFVIELLNWRETVGQREAPPETYNVSLSVVSPQEACLLYTSPSPRDGLLSRMPSSA